MRAPGSSNASEAGVLNPRITDSVQSLHRVVPTNGGKGPDKARIEHTERNNNA